jgi:dethiobiotin synthetase
LSDPTPRTLVVVVGTGTEVGKTWVSARLLTGLRAAGLTVAARKPAQSFDPGDDPGTLDAAVLGAASGEDPEVVCRRERWYEVAMAPPMAAARLGRPPFTLDDLAGELSWPAVDIGLVETAGGVHSPLAEDGDAIDLVRRLRPNVVLLVADAGLGTLNAVRLTTAALAPVTPLVVLNRYDPADPLHVANRRWLAERDGIEAVALPGEDDALVAAVRAATPVS